jgi:drug/metabolite transporter (DMT)-like permease
MNQRLLGAVAATSAAAIWGGMYVVSKLVLDVIPPITLVVIRFGVALPVLLIWYRASGGRALPRRETFALALVSLVGFCLSLGAQFGGTRLSTASNGSLITSATPAFVVPFAYWLLRERPTRWKLLGLALATAGVLAVILPGADQAQNVSASLLGNLLLVIAALTWALYSVLVKRSTNRGVSALAVTLYVTAWGITWNTPLAAVELSSARIGAITPLVIAGIVYLGVISTAIAFYLWNRGFELLDANTAALCFFAQPLVGALLGALLLHERLGLGFFVGALLILVGATVSQISISPLVGVAQMPMLTGYNAGKHNEQTGTSLQD